MEEETTTPQLQAERGEESSDINLETVYDIPVQLTVVLGQTTMSIGQLLKLGRGAVVELDRKVGEAIDIFINDRLVAKGEIVIVDERIGITLTEIIKVQKEE